jgi:RNA polymerase sigma-70 factor (ECF subfamily)
MRAEHHASTAGPTQEPVVLSDEQLLSRYRDDAHRESFDLLVRRYEREIFNYLRKFLGDSQLAEDAFQATFLQVHLKCGQYDSQRPFRPWLYAIAAHQAIDAQRRCRRHRMASLDRGRPTGNGDDSTELAGILEHGAPGPHSLLELGEHRTWVRRAVQALPEALRSAVTLIYYRGLKYREAADELGVPVGTVKSRMHAALLKLQDAWSDAHGSHER